MGRKSNRLKSRLAAAQATLSKSQQANLMLHAENDTYERESTRRRHQVRQQFDFFNAELARYKFIDQQIERMLEDMPGHPLLELMRNQRMRLQYPSEYIHIAFCETLFQECRFDPNAPVAAATFQTLTYHMLDIYHRRFDHRGIPKVGIRADFDQQSHAYILPDSLKRLTPREQYDVVMRELAPAIIAMLTEKY